MRQNRSATVLSGLAVLACLFAGAWMSQVPMMSGGRHPALEEVAGMVAIPTAAALAACWAARRNRSVVVLIATIVVAGFSLVTGYSFGAALWPAAILLALSTVASLAGE